MPSPNSDRQSNPLSQSLLSQWGAWFRKPSTLIVGGVIVVLGTGGYLAAQQLAYRRISPWLETELSKTLQRPVKVGKVEQINFNQVRLGASSLPATANDTSTINIQGIEINVNPLLFLLGKPVEIEAKIISPRVVLKQNKKGEWLNLNLPKGEGKFELPLDLNVKFKLEDAQASLTPYSTQKAILIKLDGTGRYQNSRQKKQQEIGYDLNLALQQSQLRAQGNTIIETGQTQTALEIKRLNLPELASLIPNFPVKVSEGQLNGDVKIDSPGFAKIEATKTLGNIALANLQAKIDAFKVPLIANLNIDLEGQKINIKQGEIALGKLRTKITGAVDWRRGYNLALQTNIIEMRDLFNSLAIAFPLPTTGKLKAQFQLTGQLENPLLLGKIENLNPLTLDKIKIQSFQTNLRGSLDLLSLQNMQVKPQAGGKIEGKAELQLGLLQSLKKKQLPNWEKMLVNLQLQGQLPSQKLLEPYQVIPNHVQLGDLNVEGKISGMLGQPLVRVKWRDYNSSSIAQVIIHNQGEAISLGHNFVLQNRLTNGDKGEIQLKALANFKGDRWQASVQAKDFLLSPWFEVICSKKSSNCPATFSKQAWRMQQAKVELTGSLAHLSPANLRGQGQLLIASNSEKINLESQLNQGQLITAIALAQVSLNPYLQQVTVPVKLQQLQAKINLPLSPIWYGKTVPLNQVQATANLNLDIANKPVTAQINWQRQFLTLGANLSPFYLNAFLPQLAVKTELVEGKINLATQVNDVQSINWHSLSGNSNLQLKIANSPFSVNSQIRQGQLTAIAQVGKINLQKFIPQLTIPTQLNQGKVTVLARLDDLIRPQPNLKNLEAIADLQLALAGGIVNNTSHLKQNQWQSYLQIKQLRSEQLLTNTNLKSLAPLNGNLALSGQLDQLFKTQNSVPITVKNATLRSGEQSIDFNGNLVLAQLFKQPQLAEVNLSVKSQINLEKIPLNNALNNLAIAESLRPESLQLAGIAQFQGQLTGKNITSFKQINLQGQTSVNQLALNQEKFEPSLSGSLRLEGDQILKLSLKGKEDQLTLDLESCPQKSCFLAYLPNYFVLKHSYQTTMPIMAEGQRLGENFQLKINQFPLALLNLKPGKAYNITGILQGDLQAQLNFNWQHQRGEGSLTIDQLALGYLKTDKIAANFDYKADILNFNDTYVQLGKSRYDLDASLNIRTLAVESRLRIVQAKVHDLLTALRISNVESLVYLFQKQPENLAKNLQPNIALGHIQDPLQDQVNLLYKVDQDIRKWANLLEKKKLPNELNVEGIFDAELHLSGNLTAPELAMQIKGKNWSWYPQAAFANIIPPLGLVMTNTRFLPIQTVNLQASLKNGTLTVNPSEIIIKDSRLALEGNFSLEQNSAIWSVDNLSLDTIGTFLKLPSEISGNLNAQGGITGTLTNPQIRGSFTFADAAINARPIHQAIAGNFSYDDAHLEVITDRESPLFFYTKIPFAVSKKDKDQQQAEKLDQFVMQIKAKKEALALIGAFTQEQFAWVSGDGEINLKAMGELRFDQEISLADFEVKGDIKLQEVVIRSPIFQQPATISGVIELDNKILKVDKLEGVFAQGKLSLAGNLPIFKAEKEIENPLTLKMNKTQIDLPNLFEGEAEGIVIFKGTAFKPEVTGGVRLANGQIFVPESPELPSSAISPLKVSNWFKTRQSQPLLNPELNNFKIILDNLFVEQTPLYDFSFGGQLMVNGSLANWNQLKPQGQVILSRGRVSFLDTRFLLDRRYRNQISFIPSQGILNPNLDIKMRTIVSELPQSKRLRSAESNEIPDDTLNQVQRIDINLNIDGSLSQLLPNLNQAQVDACNREKQFRPLRGTPKLSEWRMKQITTCLEILATQGLDNQQIFHNPAIHLSSNPARSQGEIVRLLGEQFIVLADALQSKNSGQLLQYGITQLAIPMIFQGTIYDIETSIGNSLGATDIRIVPFLEAIYQVEDKAFVRFSYDYSFNEVTIRYEKQF